MSVNYYARHLLYVAVSLTDFTETISREQVNCAHPFPAGARYCPTCGTSHEKRVVIVHEERLRKGINPDLIGYADDEGDLTKPGWFLDFAKRGWIKTSKLELMELRPGVWVLAYQLDRVKPAWDGGQDPKPLGMDALMLEGTKVQQMVEKLGLGKREVFSVVMLEAS